MNPAQEPATARPTNWRETRGARAGPAGSLRGGLRDEADDDDPLLSVVNLVDIFLVLIAALLLVLARSPAAPWGERGDFTLILRPGQPDMTLVVRQGDVIRHYRADAAAGAAGLGVRAGTAYRLQDGSLVYVPEPAVPH